MRRRLVTVMVHLDGALETRQYRVPLWAFRAAQVAGVGLAILIVLFFTVSGPLTRTAARVPGLEREVQRLRTENARVQELARALDRAEARYARLRSMLGADMVPERQRPAPGLATAVVVLANPPGAKARYEVGLSVPRYWPLDQPGYVTRGLLGTRGSRQGHPGIDVAVALGTPVRAAGGGVVVASGNDPEYGLYVLLNHPEEYQTMYGHASRILVGQGEEVQAGQVIALSGSTGRSTAPHLHFEIRRDGNALDPLSVVKEEGK